MFGNPNAATNCTRADAYASALCVLGRERAKEDRFHREARLSALLIMKTDAGVQTTELSNFNRYLDVQE